MKYLHTMVRVSDVEKSLDFYVRLLGLREQRRWDNEGGRFTLIFLAAPGDESACIELTYNWDPETYGEGRNFGHLRLRSRRYLRRLSAPDGWRRHHQSAAARRPHGICPFAGQHIHRAAAVRRTPAAGRTLVLHAEQRALVMAGQPALTRCAEAAGLDLGVG